ncbi:flagellar hook-basal body complex protein FliE [Enterovibrio makurazakiensis]|uniref:Flagellar hook-basal body complex protein FliE n=1 Tax=Enterovibrio gelatinilyticus TaxID=2899819 RepID=A0ABT5QZV3_9GAMM|nr:flagellar hook-basal body complex protein FliE [Enterovibrio sp. ZSDZ42]MDD1793547.1 flagellar hook-basal body complex protein FliE [Enterovibrio sp. ZSDZ42]
MQNDLMGLDSVLSQISDVRQSVTDMNAISIAPNPLSNGAVGQVSFTDIISNAIRNVDSQGQEASQKMTAVDTGQSDDLVGAMIASQKASLSFTAMVQVRNSVMMAYDDVMKMPV